MPAIALPLGWVVQEIALCPVQNSGEIYQPKQRMYWVLLFTLLLWEVDMNVVSGQIYYQLALLILFLWLEELIYSIALLCCGILSTVNVTFIALMVNNESVVLAAFFVTGNIGVNGWFCWCVILLLSASYCCGTCQQILSCRSCSFQPCPLCTSHELLTLRSLFPTPAFPKHWRWERGAGQKRE